MSRPQDPAGWDPGPSPHETGDTTQPYGGQPYPTYGQQPAGTPSHGTQPYGQQPQPMQPWGGYGQPVAPQHPSSSTALVLGIVGLLGGLFTAGLALVVSPFAWYVGGRAVREIDAYPGQWSGRDQAQAGRVMGIVGTVFLVLGMIAVAAFVWWIIGLFPDTSTLDDGSNV